MNTQDTLIKLRTSTGMTRKEFLPIFRNSLPHFTGLGVRKPYYARLFIALNDI